MARVTLRARAPRPYSPGHVYGRSRTAALICGPGRQYARRTNCTCSATTIREHRNEWIKAGIFARLKQTTLKAYDRIAGRVMQETSLTAASPRLPKAASASAAARWTGASRA
jgi:hypothetical protein